VFSKTVLNRVEIVKLCADSKNVSVGDQFVIILQGGCFFKCEFSLCGCTPCFKAACGEHFYDTTGTTVDSYRTRNVKKMF
jgi:hypothetical protein